MRRRPLRLDAGHVWDWSRPYILGIVNVTPDSFSDGGRHAATDAAVAHGERLLAEGADAVDVGGESTRPGSTGVTAQVELDRVVPVVRALARRGALVSVDTTKLVVARAAFEAGARILNDVGMGDPPEVLAPVVEQFGGAYVLMHSRGTPATMTARAAYPRGLVATVLKELDRSALALRRAGLAPWRILVDPGIGFAKRAEHSLSLLGNIARVRALGYPVCVGPSRKSFIDATGAYAPAWSVPAGGQARSDSATGRLGGTAAAVALAVAGGAEVVRVHDVATMRQCARVAHAIARAASRAPRVDAGGGG